MDAYKIVVLSTCKTNITGFDRCVFYLLQLILIPVVGIAGVRPPAHRVHLPCPLIIIGLYLLLIQQTDFFIRLDVLDQCVVIGISAGSINNIKSAEGRSKMPAPGHFTLDKIGGKLLISLSIE